jgi:hypothetical protein
MTGVGSDGGGAVELLALAVFAAAVGGCIGAFIALALTGHWSRLSRDLSDVEAVTGR